jgi:hypothetical protein
MWDPFGMLFVENVFQTGEDVFGTRRVIDEIERIAGAEIEIRFIWSSIEFQFDGVRLQGDATRLLADMQNWLLRLQRECVLKCCIVFGVFPKDLLCPIPSSDSRVVKLEEPLHDDQPFFFRQQLPDHDPNLCWQVEENGEFGQKLWMNGFRPHGDIASEAGSFGWHGR